MSAGMTTAITPRIVIEECQRLGIRKEQLLREAGISPNMVDGLSMRFPVEKMHGLWQAALRLTRDSMLAVHIAEKVPFGAYGALDHMWLVSSVPAEALARGSRLFSLYNSAFLLSFRSRREQAYLELHNPGDPRDLPRPYIEYILASYFVRLRFATQRKCAPAEIHVTYGRPAATGVYERLFRAPFRFREPVNRLVFPGHLMEIRNPLADPELGELLEAYARQKLRDLPCTRDPLAEIREAITRNLETGNVTLALLSRQLAKSCRSLQRELHSNGATFHQLLDSARRQRALTLLADHDRPLDEVAAKLRFSSTSAFCRAFQRWMGSSPHHHRMQPHSSGAEPGADKES